jgi:hypothetical protein
VSGVKGRSGRRTYDYDSLVVNLDDWLPQSYDQAVRFGDIVAFLGLTPKLVRKIIHHHRNVLGDESHALLCRADGSSHWYWLSIDPDEIKRYDGVRINDSKTRLTTINKVAKRGVKNTDGRSVEGQEHRTIAKHVGRLLEDIEDLHLYVQEHLSA